MTRYIGIDYSTTSCGIAIVDDRLTSVHWQVFTLRSKPTGDNLADYYDRIRDLSWDLGAAIDWRPGDVIGIEGIAFAGKGRAVDRLHYAWHRTAEHLVRTATEPLIVTTNQVKQLATGKGTAQKDEVLLATERRIPQAQVRNNDEADAVWIAVGASILAGSPVIDLPAAHMPKAWTKGKN
ncbi:crossover junction endodeoxyribonuclease RuvC [Microbacterium sp. XT11]|uniref:crossover junction endodeoxyribonuclease RuvC n=1 Tax=Microbacterium sp. XT11 TaxID=367477 RepID=UPI00082D66DF|nr:crossover junction endodeoxyribonuclease RuvC [Microbacterium sp. XT11]